MASVTMRYEFVDGGAVAACVEMATGYPDAMHEAVARCSDALRNAITTVGEIEDGGEE